MKTAAWMIAALAALVASRADADGVCYDPDHVSGKSADSVSKDMDTIAAKGFSHVRTYISKFGPTDMAGTIVKKSGLRFALGVPYPLSDYNDHIKNAVNAAKAGNVDYIFVGNENAMGADISDMVRVINSVKSQLRNAGVNNVKVGTVQRTIDYTGGPSGISSLVAACDVVGVNIHPFFTPNTKAENAIENTKSQWNSVINSGLPGIADKLILTETGWPTAGEYAGSVGSLDGAQKYFAAYKSWASFLPDNKKFYFQFFDTPYKGDTYEKYYGLFGADSSSKFNAAGNPAPAPAPTSAPSPTTSAPTTSAPTKTPAPTTAEPSSTPAPSSASPSPAPSSSNSTSSVDGSSSHATDLTSGSSSSATDAGLAESTSGSVAGSKGDSTETETGAENESGVLAGASGTVNAGGVTVAGATGTTSTSTTDSDGANATGNSDNTASANTQSGSSSGTAGVAIVACVGVAAIGAAAAFVYKTRQKAKELEDSEDKRFDSFAVTPNGGCSL